MSNSTYTVASHDPISIFPAGSQPAATILNNGANTVYVANTASNTGGWPIAPGNTLGWNAASPLYAYVDSATSPTTILVSTDGNVLPYGSVVATNTNKLLYGGSIAVPAPPNIPITIRDIGAYASLIITFNPKWGIVFGGGLLRIDWKDLAGNPLYQESVGFNDRSSDFCQLITSVKGPTAMITPVCTSTLDALSVAGSTRALPDSYMIGDSAVNTAPPLRSAIGQTLNVAPAAAGIWRPRMWAGHNKLFISCSSTSDTGNGIAIEVKDAAGGYYLAAILPKSSINPIPNGALFDIVIPPTPIQIIVTNNTIYAQTFTYSLASEL